MSDETPTPAPDTRGCRVVRPGDPYVGVQALQYVAGVTKQSVGSRGICLVVATMPPGARSRAHHHEGIETAIHILEGEAVTYHGARLEHEFVARAGDYVYIPADVPHLVVNRSDGPCRAFIAHTAGDDQEGIVMHPELEARIP
ncbi:cupin domain-containing protein [Roseisolibacter sp. H3M3-2]|uniref:cupin domain-containing protein n=1 Tax=Roseisolibacter sp. H3M3-2 TaxID=3031323 RepID=UPI0023D9F4B1|nr:cupin domain-containing protein [Roseisolibacter sp. H3M3-2]MDF1502371.1 cupin domain-containing protein [Roseisolibacter sp. H3M3-2]